MDPEPDFRSMRFTSGAWLAAILLVCPPPLAGQQEPEPIASIDRIVVNGQKRNEILSTEGSVVRPRTGQTEPVRAGMLLFPGDEIKTGAATQVVLIFLDDPNQKSNQVTVDAGSRVRLVRTNSLFLFLGRLLANVRSVFDVRTESVTLGARGTLFEAAASPDGRSNLLVLEGDVDMARGDFSDPPSPGTLPVFEFTAISGAIVTAPARVTITNQCTQRVRFEIRAPANLPWIRLRSGSVDVQPGATRTVDIMLSLDAAALPFGAYSGDLLALCLDCGRVRGCTSDRFSFPLAVRVTSAAVRTAKRQESTVNPGALAPTLPIAAPYAEFRSILTWNNGVVLAARPTHPPEGVSPYFANLAERRQVLEDASYRALWLDDPAAIEALGDLYIDWSDAPKALELYRRAAVFDPSRQQAVPYLIKLGEALRPVGRLDESQQVLSTALRADPRSARAHNALAALYLDRARIARDRNDLTQARGFLMEARASADRSLQISPDMPSAWTNLGEAYRVFGDLDRQIQPSQASPAYEAAVNAFNSAIGRSAEYPLAHTGLGRVYHSLGLAAQIRGERATASVLFGQARSRYNQAISTHPDLAQAHVGLGNLVRDAEPANVVVAIEHYHRAVAARPRDPEAYFHLGELLERTDPQQAARFFRAYLRFENPPFLQGERGRRAGGGTPRNIASVPSLRGLNERQTRDALARTGFVLGRIESRPSAAHKNTVIHQQPAASAQASAGSAVDIVLAGEGKASAPNVIGRTREETEALLASVELRGKFKEERNSQPQGTVFHQKPRAGEMIKPGAEVEVFLSRGDPRNLAPAPTTPIPPNVPVGDRVLVPNLVGASSGEAPALLSRLTGGRLLASVRDERGGPGRSGIVVDQFPPADSERPYGSVVTLIVRESSAPPGIPVPDVRNREVADAERHLRAAGLTVTRIVDADGRALRAGVVIWQNPSANVPVQPRTGVELIVRAPSVSGPPPLFEVPSFRGLPIQKAASLAESHGLQVRIDARAGSQHGTVLDQHPRARSRARPGDLVTLFVAQGIIVPDVRRMTVRDATETIRRTDGRLKVESIRDRNGKSTSTGTVENQSPPADTPVQPGTGVHLVVFSESDRTPRSVAPPRVPMLVTVPDVLGMDARSASKYIFGQTKGALKVNRIEDVRGRNQSSGRVLKQDPSGQEKGSARDSRYACRPGRRQVAWRSNCGELGSRNTLHFGDFTWWGGLQPASA